MAFDPITAGLDLIKKLIPDKTQAAEANARLLELHAAGDLQKWMASADIIKAEAQSEHFLTATWRPILMLTFGALIVARFLGWTAPGINEVEYLKLWDIILVGIGGYTIGRSAEKIVPAIATAMKK